MRYDPGGVSRMAVAWSIAGLSLLAWVFLLLARGGYWRVRPTLDAQAGAAASPSVVLPSVVAVIPARDEADILGDTLPTVLTQNYPGAFRVVLVDDRSEDGTGDVARAAAAECGRSERLTVVGGEPLSPGWAGKVWAMAQGVAHPAAQSADFIWFTDADIAHRPGILRAMVQKAEEDRRDLVSLMARLRVDSGWDRLLIPAFVYFFSKLYPFRFVADPHRRTAGAAGGTMLVRRTALARAGGLEAIHGALIDDCALGRSMKRSGSRIWLGFTRSADSVRRYGSLRSTWDMVARSAYTQLHTSCLLLLGTVLGMVFLYAVPPAAAAAGLAAAVRGVPGAGFLAVLGGAAWLLLTLSFIPIVRHHRAGWPVSPLLPVAGALYVAMTIDSARWHAAGRGGAWKGRVQAPAGEAK